MYKVFFTSMNFPLLTSTDIFSFSYFYLFIDTFLYLMFNCFNCFFVCVFFNLLVNAEKFDQIPVSTLQLFSYYKDVSTSASLIRFISAPMSQTRGVWNGLPVRSSFSADCRPWRPGYYILESEVGHCLFESNITQLCYFMTLLHFSPS